MVMVGSGVTCSLFVFSAFWSHSYPVLPVGELIVLIQHIMSAVPGVVSLRVGNDRLHGGVSSNAASLVDKWILPVGHVLGCVCSTMRWRLTKQLLWNILGGG